jgi:NAD(P)-dependent dehydrogenase (short-subunit alcohol dehydrogenase family)
MSTTQVQPSFRIPVSASTWFITGINRGLGRSIAEEVMRRGGKVAGTVRSLTHADQLKKEYPDRLWVTTLDLSDLANVAEAFRAAVERFGRVHAVVSNAGYSLLGAAEELPLEAMRHIVDTNLIGSIELARAALAHMRPLGGGLLIQISSGAGQVGFAGLSPYCATKWGIEGFYESLTQEQRQEKRAHGLLPILTCCRV